MWSRSIEQLRQTTQLLAFDLINYGDFFTGTQWNNFLTDPNLMGGFTNHVAMNLGADAFVALLTMPEMGSHANTPKFDGTARISPAAGGGFGASNINIDINDGRAFESNWRNDVGFFWYDMLNRAGGYYDKVMAVQAITDPELLLLQRDTPTDIRLFQLSFYTMYPEQMIRLFGGILSEDEQDYSPVYNAANKTIARTHVATLADPPATRGRQLDGAHLPLDPQTHFTVQLWSAVQTISQFPATYDQRYMDYARLWIVGSLEAIDPGTAPTVTFVDPFSGQTYMALSFDGTKDGVGTSSYVHPCTSTVLNESGVAAKMIYHLRDIETLRQKAIMAGDAATESALELQLKKYLDAVNIMRDLTKQFGQGTSALP
jgi:hypothetical protein